MKNVLEVKSLSKNFSKKEILENISFEIKEKEVFGLIGINGAGKSTLMKIILDLLKIDSGEVEIFGKKSIYKESREKVFYLPEKFYPSIHLTGREFCALACFNKKIKKEDLKFWAKKLDLDDKMLDQKITKYSKGMAQKLGLISMFLSDAKLLILDEPMSGLDPHIRISLKESLKAYTKKGNTIFFSSHILSDIDEICDRIGVLHQKKLNFIGTSQDFKKQHKSDNLEKGFLNIINNSIQNR